jgi:ubiquinone/menaquinone biosynthesis C-methylase UbiE
MSTSPNRRRGQPGQPTTYFVQDQHNREELARQTIQDQFITKGMGGVLPEQPDAASLRRVLDVGCGPGGWLIETARAYPSITQLVGVDVNSKMVEYAQAQAVAKHVETRVEFKVMDALKRMEFPDGHFDLVNQRLGWSFLRTWDWPNLLLEYRRITRGGGVIRLSEGDAVGTSNSPTLTRLLAIWLDAMYEAGHLFTQEKEGVTSQLERLLQKVGLQDVQTRSYLLEYRAGTPECKQFCENMRLFLQTSLPFMRKWSRHVPENYDQLYQQALSEMQRPDFAATWGMVTSWGINQELVLARDDR